MCTSKGLSIEICSPLIFLSLETEQSRLEISDLQESSIRKTLNKFNDVANALSSIISSENKRKSSKKIQLRSKLSFKVGTPLYLSPEQAVGVVYDEKVDIYAIGLTLLELCYNFSTHHEKLMGFENIKKQKLPQSVEENMKDEAELIKILTDPDPSKRPTANNIIKLKNYKSWKKDCNGTFNLLNSAHK